MIHAHVVRLLPHSSSDDHRKYRTEEDIEKDRQRDPIPRLTRFLIDHGHLTQDEADAMKEEVKHTVDKAAEWAETQSLPDPSTVQHHLYGISHAHPPGDARNLSIPETRSF